MKKIPCLFVRVFEAHHVKEITRKVTPDCEWVLASKGVASVKFDGTACAIINGKLYARYDCKPSKKAKRRHIEGEPWPLSQLKVPPEGAIACQEPDLITGHWPHWVPVLDQPQFKYHREAFVNEPDGTYELVGPKVGRNPYGLAEHKLVPHGCAIVHPERSYDGIRLWLFVNAEEGLVFHHPDGRMCKIRRADFGLEWPKR